METNLRKRIQDILALKRYSVSRLAGNNGSSTQVRLNNQINKTTTISAETIMLVLETFPDVSAEWLLRGVGEMIGSYGHASNSVTLSTMSGGNIVAGVNSSVNSDALLEEKDARIAELTRDKEYLMQLLTNITTKQ